MHLLALGAFWRQEGNCEGCSQIGLNATIGAPCLLTIQEQPFDKFEREGLNAPYGARCYLAWLSPEDMNFPW